jgi:hypothetical protein
MSSEIARRVALRYKQKGVAKRKRKQQYRRTKIKSRRQSKKWRATHRGEVKRYRRKVKVNPMQHRLRKRAGIDLTQTEPIEFWDLETNQGGEIQGITEEAVEAVVDGETRYYDPIDFLDSVAFMFEDDEEELYDLLDPFFGVDPEEDDTPQ